MSGDTIAACMRMHRRKSAKGRAGARPPRRSLVPVPPARYDCCFWDGSGAEVGCPDAGVLHGSTCPRRGSDEGTKERRMATRDDGHPTGPTGPQGREPAETGAREQKPAEAPPSAAEAAEREQARQLSDGTESPG